MASAAGSSKAPGTLDPLVAHAGLVEGAHRARHQLVGDVLVEARLQDEDPPPRQPSEPAIHARRASSEIGR